MKARFTIILIFLLALSLRLYGINWDQFHHLHPDERFLTMVETTIKLPANLTQYLSTATSPLNPYNYIEYQFFVYGTFPLFITKIVGEIINLRDYDQIFLVGRALSAISDAGCCLLLYLLAKKVFKNRPRLVFLPSFLYAFTVLPLQLSHFFTVDTFLNFFILATFTALVYELFPLAAISFGLALACKISAIYFAPIYGLTIILYLLKRKNLLTFLWICFYTLIITFLTFRFFQPYSFVGLFTLNPLFIKNIQELQAMSSPNSFFPPAVQWFSKIRLLFPFQNLILWGLGLPLTSLIILSLIKIKLNKIPTPIWLSLIWSLYYFIFQGLQFASTMRYLLVIYPFICLFCIYFSKDLNRKIMLGLTIGHVCFGLIFLSIYSRPHSRVQASLWIYDHLPAGSLITNEYWDDPLPLYLPGLDPYSYHGTMLSLYDPDSPEKWQKIQPEIDRANYLIMSSNRLWASIPRVPDHFPQTALFYQNLFDEKLQFSKEIEINSYPGISLSFLSKCYYFGPTNFPYIVKKNAWFTVDSQCLYPGIYLRDDIAEEAFTVYDHPKVLIYKNINNNNL